MVMLKEFEEYFAFYENLLVLLPLFDILKCLNFFAKNRKVIKIGKYYEYKTINVKFCFAPSIVEAIDKLVSFLHSENHLLGYINDSDNIRITFMLEISRGTLNLLEKLHNCDSDDSMSKLRLTACFYRCKSASIILEIIARFQQLACILSFQCCRPSPYCPELER